MTKTNDSLLYLASLPERLPRAVAASAGGLLYESSLVLLPEWTRDMQLYQTFIGRGLRIIVEWAGGVQNVMPPSPVTAGRLAVRKVAGNAVELTSFLIVGWSPAVAAGGRRRSDRRHAGLSPCLTDELKRLGMLPPEQEFTTVDGLLDSIEGATGVLSRAIDIPPLAQAELQVSAKEMRAAWLALRENLPGLPTGESLRAIANQMQETAERENTSVWLISSLIGLGAVQAGIRLGQANVFDYYRSALGDMRSIGLSAYVSQVSKPYRSMVASHLDPKQESYIERTLKRVRASGRQTELACARAVSR